MAESPSTREREKILCLDFDNTMHSGGKWKDGKPSGPPTDGCREFIEEMIEDGFEITICSARINEADDTPEIVLGIVEFLERFQFPRGIAVLGTKPSAAAYVDDRAVRFRGSWDEVREALKEPVWSAKEPKEAAAKPPSLADLFRRSQLGLSSPGKKG